MPSDALPEWERVLSSAARLQRILPDAVLVGGSAAAIHAGHRLSTDADHVLGDLAERFDGVLEQLESVAGRETARIRKPVLILGNLDGIQTGIRQLIRRKSLETTRWKHGTVEVTVPTLAEVLRIKAVLILKRNATRDYLDYVALAGKMDDDTLVQALTSFDDLYPQPNRASPIQQLQTQLANPLPYDLDETNLAEYKNLERQWHDSVSYTHLRAHET